MDLEDFWKPFGSLSVKCIETKEGTFPILHTCHVCIDFTE